MRTHPFDVEDFIKNNKELVKKFIKKNTYSIVVDDFILSKDQMYNNNASILRAGATFDFSDIQKLEYVKCMKSCVYFTQKYVKIISIDEGVIPFKLYQFQRDLLNLCQENRFVISMMSRQQGKTQTTAAFLLWFSTFVDSKTCAILANKASQAREILSRIQMSYEMLPNFLKQPVKFYNKGSMKLENESELFCAATSSSSIRGKSCVSAETKVSLKHKETGKETVMTMLELQRTLFDIELSSSFQTYIKNSDYLVLTPDGWSDFEGLVINHNRELIELKNHDLFCTEDHLISVNSVFVEAKTLEHKKTNRVEDVFDLFKVEKRNQYYTNNVLSHNCALVYIDEGAFIPNDMEFYESTYPVISSGNKSRVIITSTPNGQRGLFYKLWIESTQGLNSYKNLEVPWYLNPTRDKAWAAEQVSNTSQEQFDQEHGLKFRGSQSSLLAGHVLEVLPIYKPTSYGDLKVFKDPEKGRQYFITVDTSRGVGGDYSAFIVFDISEVPYQVVARYQNNTISPTIYPQVIRSVAEKYNNAFVLVEINDIGEQVASILYYDFEYENILLCYSDKSIQKIGYSGETRLGVRTNVQVKSIGCSTIKTMIETGRIDLKDEELIGQFGNFIPKGKSYEAAPNSHDDLVMCCVLFAWASVQQYFIDLTDKDVKRSIQETAMDGYMDELVPFGIISNGFEEFDGLSNPAFLD